MIPEYSGIKTDVRQGQTITIIEADGGQVVDFFAEATGSPNEFLSTVVTIDCNESLRLNGKGPPNCLDNINHALSEQRPLITPVNLFMHTKINTDGSISVGTPLSKAGDKIVIKSLLNITLGVAACSVSESKYNSGKSKIIKEEKKWNMLK